MMIRVNGRSGSTVQIEYMAGDVSPYYITLLHEGVPIATRVAHELIADDYDNCFACKNGGTFLLRDNTDVAVVREFLKRANAIEHKAGKKK